MGCPHCPHCEEWQRCFDGLAATLKCLLMLARQGHEEREQVSAILHELWLLYERVRDGQPR
jgi:hypothetical protein